MGRTKRNRKLDKRRRRETEREVARVRAAGEPLLAIKRPDTKTRSGLLSFGQPWRPESSYARRLRDARRFLGIPDPGLPPSD